ncbi:hypothetical protein thsps117_06700 [Pseudomonas sp. No.117]
MAPPIKMISESTAAKIGRRMKNWEKFIGAVLERKACRGAAGVSIAAMGRSYGRSGPWPR